MDPTAVAPHLNMAGMLLESQQYNAAASQYREALKLQPNNVGIKSQLEEALTMRDSTATEPATQPVKKK